LLQQVVNEDMAVSSRLLQASKHISAVHGSLYQVMTRQAAGGSPADSETKLKSLMAEINGIKVELTAIKARLPADQQAKFGGVLKDLGTYHRRGSRSSARCSASISTRPPPSSSRSRRSMRA
jgi:methyl-accepting chemotaxis protein